MEAVLSAIIVAAGSVVCQLLINRKGRKDREISDAVKETKLEARLSNIETKLDIHNGYAGKLGDIRMDIAVIKNDIRNMKGEK